MQRERRRLLEALGVATVGGLAGCSGLLGGGRETTVVEDFADEDLSEYRSQNTPVGRGVSIVVGREPLSEGTAGLAITGDANTRHYSLPGDGLDTYPERGDVIAVRQYAPAGRRAAFFWAYQEDGSFYAVEADAAGGGMKISKKAGNSKETLVSADVPAGATDQWTNWVVEYDLDGDGAIVARLETDDGERLASLEATDPELGGGGIGFTQGASRDVGTVFESVEVRR